jgi:hypothetical protein
MSLFGLDQQRRAVALQRFCGAAQDRELVTSMLILTKPTSPKARSSSRVTVTSMVPTRLPSSSISGLALSIVLRPGSDSNTRIAVTPDLSDNATASTCTGAPTVASQRASARNPSGARAG